MDSPEKRLWESSSDFSATDFPEKKWRIFAALDAWLRFKEAPRKNTKLKRPQLVQGLGKVF